MQTTILEYEFNKYPLNIPIFDKLVDDKLKKIRRINQKCDVLILEGWCCGCTPINNKYLKKNLNFIEKTYDKNLKWRKFYNSRLKGEYKELFQLFDKTIYLKAPSFNYVISWRGKQEKANNSKKCWYIWTKKNN